MRSFSCKIPHWSLVYRAFLSEAYTWEETPAQMSLGLNDVQKEILQNTKLD